MEKLDVFFYAHVRSATFPAGVLCLPEVLYIPWFVFYQALWVAWTQGCGVCYLSSMYPEMVCLT